MTYRIVRRDTYDRHATISKTVWLVEEYRRNWLGILTWKPLMHCDWTEYEPYNQVTEFPSKEVAQACIDNLIRGLPRLGYTHSVEA